MFFLSSLLLRAFFPERCVRCRTWDTPLCTSCARSIFSAHGAVRTHGAIFEIFSLGHWSDSYIRTLIHDIKFFGVRGIISKLPLELLREKIPISYDALLPVPLHPRRVRERGFSQSDLLAHALADILHIPLFSDILVRTRYTKSQSSLPHSHRKKNVAGVFRLHSAYQKKEVCLPFTRPLLVDDVWTTGATLEACARVLREHGCQTVSAVVIARADSARKSSRLSHGVGIKTKS